MLDVLVSTIDEKRTPGGLEFIPGPFRLLVDARRGWSEASNALLDLAAAKGHDALFLDDDVTLTATSLALLPLYRGTADIFGFTLITPTEQGWRIASAGFGCAPDGNPVPAADMRDVFEPAYVAHVTASAMYIKNAVLRSGLRFPVWPGAHFEDLAFTYEAWMRGFRVAYLPGMVEHPIEGGGGRTKAAEEAFHQKRAQNYQAFQGWGRDAGLQEAIAAGTIPTRRKPI